MLYTENEIQWIESLWNLFAPDTNYVNPDDVFDPESDDLPF